ncbi:MAG: hypothetical protein KGJ54_02625 [Betaproteobacteria bacterium]|nr:hypothetical protein [Betaproteobacteria bacterium]
MRYRFPLNFREPVELTPDEAELDRVEPSWAKFAVFLRTGFRFGAEDGNLKVRSLVAVRRLLDVYRKRSEEGNTLALLYAVKVCGEEGLPLPEWLAQAFSEQLTKFGDGDAHSLDEMFCSPNLPTRGKKARTARRDWKIGVEMWVGLIDIQRAEPGLSFDAALTKLLAQGRYGVAKGKARRLILKVEANQNELLGKRQRLSRMRVKLRKL